MVASVYTSPIEKPLLEIVLRRLIDRYKNSPLALPEAVLLLPNRRSCLECKRLFLELAGDRALLLPRLYAIGDVDEEALWEQGALLDDEMMRKAHAVPPAMSQTKRLLALAREIWVKQDQLDIAQMSEALNLEQAVRMAADIISFMDELAREGVAAEKIVRLSPTHYAQHWQVSLSLLKHALNWWPDYAKSQGEVSQLERRNALLGLLSDYWQQHPPNYPVIAAGSTGTQPATARLLSVIAQLPQGEVVLPGLDVHCSDEVWHAVGATHPQTHLKHLLEKMQVPRGEVEMLDWPEVAGGSFDRARLLLDSCLPAEQTHLFAQMGVSEQAYDGFSPLMCDDEQQEARLIALLLREVLEEEGKTAALITHNADLARRVRALMDGYQVQLDSASAQTLLDAPIVQFLQLMAQAATHAQAPIPLLSVMKHSCCFLADDDVCVGEVENDSFRGIRRQDDTLKSLYFLAEKHEEIRRLYEALAPFYALCSRKEVLASELVQAHWQAASDVLAADAEGALSELAEPLDAFVHAFDALGKIQPALYPALFRRCAQMMPWFPKSKPHPRLHILSPMEARLMQYDRVVLGGLNEQEWPQLPKASGWLNSPLRHEVGLPDVQEHIGLQAHDWVMLASHKEVFVTRAKRSGGADALPSRWLERLDALGGAAIAPRHYLHWVRDMQKVEDVQPCQPPAPAPPQEARPRNLSVTQLETLLRDPYSIYARFVLGLKALDPIDEDIGAATLGSVIHEVLEQFVLSVNDNEQALTIEHLLQCVEQVLAQYQHRPQVELIWSPRIKQMAQWIMDMERERRMHAVQVLPEQELSATFSAGDQALQLSARIDRLEHLQNGAVAISDYKAGGVPTPKEIAQGYGAQLPLSALIAESVLEKDVSALDYWLLSSGHKEPEVGGVMNKGAGELRGALEHYKEGIVVLIVRYLQENQPYYSIPVPSMRPAYNDYEQLARIQEWYGED